MPEPMMAPMPSAIRDQGPRVFLRRLVGSSASAISLSMDLQQKSWLSEVRAGSVGRSVVIGGCAKGSLRLNHRGHEGAQSKSFRDFVPLLVHRPYRFAWPRAIFLTLRFCEPRAYSRAFSGFSALRFLRDARLELLRSFLLSDFVFAMNHPEFVILQLGNLVIQWSRSITKLPNSEITNQFSGFLQLGVFLDQLFQTETRELYRKLGLIAFSFALVDGSLPIFRVLHLLTGTEALLAFWLFNRQLR